MADSELVGTAETVDAFALFTVANNAVVTRRPVSRIRGDVYSVTDEKMLMLDRYEGHPRISQREIDSIRLAEGNIAEAWIYFHIQPLHNSVLIESGDFIKQHS